MRRLIAIAAALAACAALPGVAQAAEGPLTGQESLLELPRLDMYYFRDPGALDGWGSPPFLRRVAWLRARRRLRALVAGPRRRDVRRGWLR